MELPATLLGPRSLVLIGYRATGKTTVGLLLARALGRPFVDLDQELVAAAGMTVADIVALEGWPGFRRRETALVRRFAHISGMVLATGGGVILDPENVTALRRHGLLVWLTATPEVIRRRLAEDRKTAVNRPGLGQSDALAEVEEILAQREPLYRQAADVVIDTNGLTAQEVADRILKAVLGPSVHQPTTDR
jgi:shikimate kinase